LHLVEEKSYQDIAMLETLALQAGDWSKAEGYALTFMQILELAQAED
jgi:hypothetical protein